MITFEDGRLYDLANVFMLAYPYGYSKVMLSFDFHGNTDAGGPSVPVHNNGNLECFADAWKCEHRWSYIVGAMEFRNHTADNWTTTNWNDNGNNQITFGRGASGHVVINKEGMLDVMMDCSKAVGNDKWFELKAYVKNGQGWESDITQAGTPYATNNHFAQYGKINQFDFNSASVVISNF